MAAGFQPGTNKAATDDEKKRLAALQKIPTGGTSPAPAVDGSQSGTDLSRNVNNGLNAMGGMGVMASVPLGMANRAASLAPQLANPVAKLGMNAAPNFVAGVGSGTTVAAAAPIAKAVPYLPGVNAALQEGAQANALAASTSALSGAGSALTAIDGRQPTEPIQAASAPVSAAEVLPAPDQSGSGGAVFGFYPQMAGGKRTTYAMDEALRSGVVATGPASFEKANTPAGKAIVGGGNGMRMNANQDPRSTLAGAGAIAAQAAADGRSMATPATQTDVQRSGATGGAPSAPDNPNQITATRQPNGVMSFSGGPNIGLDGGQVSYVGASGFKPSGAGVTVVPGGSFANGSPSSDAALSAARMAAADRGDFGAVRDSYQQNGGTFAGETRADTQMQDLQAQMRGATGKQAEKLLAMMNNLTAQKTAQTTQQNTVAEFGLKSQEFGLRKQASDTAQTAAGFTARSSKRIEDLQNAYEAAPAEGKSAIAEQLRVLTGKDKPAQWKALALQGGTDAMGNKTEGVLAAVNEQTGEVKRLDSQSSSGPAPLKNHVEALKKNPALAASFDQQYGKGAAAKIMGNK